MIFQGPIYIHTFGTTRPSLRRRLEMRKCCGPYQWTPSEPGKGRGFYQSNEGELMTGDSTFRLRLYWANSFLNGPGRAGDIDGYYCDADMDGDTLKPIVARLNHGRGYLAGWTMGAGMCASIDADIYGTPEDAARAAHDLAERDAERNREQNEIEIDAEVSE